MEKRTTEQCDSVIRMTLSAMCEDMYEAVISYDLAHAACSVRDYYELWQT